MCMCVRSVPKEVGVAQVDERELVVEVLLLVELDDRCSERGKKKGARASCGGTGGEEGWRSQSVSRSVLLNQWQVNMSFFSSQATDGEEVDTAGSMDGRTDGWIEGQIDGLPPAYADGKMCVPTVPHGFGALTGVCDGRMGADGLGSKGDRLDRLFDGSIDAIARRRRDGNRAKDDRDSFFFG